jgi:hypothetical protein
MSNPTDPQNSAWTEPMVARLEIEQLGDAGIREVGGADEGAAASRAV